MAAARSAFLAGCIAKSNCKQIKESRKQKINFVALLSTHHVFFFFVDESKKKKKKKKKKKRSAKNEERQSDSKMFANVIAR
jgi:hypothetical protein